MRHLLTTKEFNKEELLELIHRILEEKSKEEFIPLGEKSILGRELFNAFRKLDILQELILDHIKIQQIFLSQVKLWKKWGFLVVRSLSGN